MMYLRQNFFRDDVAEKQEGKKLFRAPKSFDAWKQAQHAQTNKMQLLNSVNSIFMQQTKQHNKTNNNND